MLSRAVRSGAPAKPKRGTGRRVDTSAACTLVSCRTCETTALSEAATLWKCPHCGRRKRVHKDGFSVAMLGGILSNDSAVRALAQKELSEAMQQPGPLVMFLLDVLASTWGDFFKKIALVYARKLIHHRPEAHQVLLNLFAKEPSDIIQSKIGETIHALASHVCEPNDPAKWLVQGQSCGWPTLLPHIIDLASNANPTCAKNAFKLMKELVPTIKDQFVLHKASVDRVLQGALQQATLPVKTSAVLLALVIVQHLDEQYWSSLTHTVPVIIDVCRQNAQTGQKADLIEILQGLVHDDFDADFFKQSMTSTFQPCHLLSEIAKSREADEDLRVLALEWITGYAEEQKPKFLTKSVPKFVEVALESCMAMMLEIEDGAAALQKWKARMDDEMGVAGTDELYSVGEESLVRITAAMGTEAVTTKLLQLSGTFMQQDAWRSKHAGLAVVKHIVECIEEDEHMRELATLLIQNCEDPHPRVRYSALHALGLLANAKVPKFLKEFHDEVMHVLDRCTDDTVECVAAKSIAVFVTFAEKSAGWLRRHSQGVIERFFALQSSQHCGIQKEAELAIRMVEAKLGVRRSRFQFGSDPNPTCARCAEYYLQVRQLQHQWTTALHGSTECAKGSKFSIDDSDLEALASNYSSSLTRCTDGFDEWMYQDDASMSDAEPSKACSAGPQQLGAGPQTAASHQPSRVEALLKGSRFRLPGGSGDAVVFKSGSMIRGS